MSAECGVRSAEFAEARELQWTWKTPAMAAMAAAICELALARGSHREFSALDLPTHTAAEHGGSGIAGAVFHRLAKDEVLCPVGGFVDAEFQQKTVKNAGGNRIGVWRLKSAARASALLRLHRAQPANELKQAELLPGA
jgi:hypothetical protein